MEYQYLKRCGADEDIIRKAATYEDLYLARVSEQHRDLYKVIGETSEMIAKVSGKFAYDTFDNTDYPVVGDWVMIDRTDDKTGNAVIHHVLPRKSVFSRKAAGTGNEIQIIASNIDIIFICMSLNANFNVRRLERYLSAAYDSMARPVAVLTKADLCDDITDYLLQAEEVCIGTTIAVCSAMNNEGYEQVKELIEDGMTVAFVGSSGVGKSTLINRLMGKEVLVTKEIRADDDRGRHTTTHRQLLVLPDGGVVIDTPGMRELQLDSGDLSNIFEDIEELERQCKFTNCTHQSEPGCAVLAALENGTLTEKRLASYRKLEREIEYGELNARKRELAKINNMFGSKAKMKQKMKESKNKRRYDKN